MERLKETLAEGGGYFGLCPVCGGVDDCLNVGSCHWMTCQEHRTKWCIGSNVFSSWKHEPEVLHRENAERLAFYREVKPYHDPSWNAEPWEPAESKALPDDFPF